MEQVPALRQRTRNLQTQRTQIDYTVCNCQTTNSIYTLSGRNRRQSKKGACPNVWLVLFTPLNSSHGYSCMSGSWRHQQILLTGKSVIFEIQHWSLCSGLRSGEPGSIYAENGYYGFSEWNRFELRFLDAAANCGQFLEVLWSSRGFIYYWSMIGSHAVLPRHLHAWDLTWPHSPESFVKFLFKNKTIALCRHHSFY